MMLGSEVFPRMFLPYIIDRKDSYGQDASLGLRDPSSPGLGRQKVVVEFSSPNLASEFQGKHLRSTIHGAFVSNLYEAMGWEVIRINYLGDWGKPIGLLGVGWERYGSEELFQADPLGHLMDVYYKINKEFEPEQIASKKARDENLHAKDEKKNTAEIESRGLFAERNAFFKRMEDCEEKAIALWKRVRDISIQNFTQLYARMGISFDEYSGESQASPETMVEIAETLKSKGLLEESGGSWMVDLKKHTGDKRLGVAIIRDRAGSSTYLLRDLAAVVERSKQYSFDKMIYVVAADHGVHFSRLFKLLELMELSDLVAKLQHVSFNEVSRMSDQLGHGHHMLGEILDRCQSAMEHWLEENKAMGVELGNAGNLSVAALFTQELSVRRGHEHAFDLSRMTSFDRGTGPNLRSWCSKLREILKTKADQQDASDEDFTSLEEDDEAINLLRLLVQWPDIVQSVFKASEPSKALEPSNLMIHLANVASQLSICFEDNLTASGLNPAQLMLYHAANIVLSGGSRLLGLEPGSK